MWMLERTFWFVRVVVRLWVIFYLSSFTLGQYECTENGHRVLSNPYRSEEYVASSTNELLCDRSLDRGWYKFEIFDKNAEMPTQCVQVNQCGTGAPIWLNTEGHSLPASGHSRRYSACVVWQMNRHITDNTCCFFSFPVTVTNCGDFFVYYLTPARGCYMAYCAAEARPKCGPGEISPDGFAPCRKSFPAILGLPEVDAVVFLDSVQLRCSFTVMESSNSTWKVYSVTWYKAERGSDMFRLVKSEDTYGNFVTLDLNDFRMGDQVLCTVQAFFNNTRELMSPPIESDPFHISVQVSPTTLNITEDGKRHLISFQSSIPLRCPSSNPDCEIRIPLSVTTDEPSPDISLSDCAVTFIPQTCSRSEERCRQAFVYTLALTDFVTDPNRISKIITGPIRSSDPFWDHYDPLDVEVTVMDTPGGYCYSFTDPHFITFDKKKYSFFKTGTFVMYRSNSREFEVHSRFWQCSNSANSVSCNCGFVVREDNDVISVDMCQGEPYDSDVDIQVRSGQPLTDGIKILEAKGGKKITIEFPSGAYVRADVSDWGMSITLRVPPMDFGQTVGLCGTFDGDSSNDFHDNFNTMKLDPGTTEAVDFVERWRLRDGGMFRSLPSSSTFDFRLPSCTCRTENHVHEAGEEGTVSGLPCLGENCQSTCNRYDYVQSKPTIRSKDVTKRYAGSMTDFGPLSFQESDGFEILHPQEGLPGQGIPLPDLESDAIDIDSSQPDFNLVSINTLHGRQKRTSNNARKRQTLKERRKRQLGEMEAGAITDFFKLLNLDFPTFPISTGSRTGNLIESYSFPPDDKAPDLLPLTPTWPTPSKITEDQAQEICEDTLKHSSLGRLCGEEGMGSDEYVLDAINLCMSDIQLTDDPTWRFETIPLLENLCEAAIERTGKTMRKRKDLESILNCPNNCSQNGICEVYGCRCNDGFKEVDCSKEDGIPILLHVEKNGLCDNRQSSCDQIKLNIEGLEETSTVDCIFSNPKVLFSKDEPSEITIRVPARVINRRTVVCPVGELENSLERSLEPSSFRQWDVKVSQDGHISMENLTLTFYDSNCIQCDWKGECIVRNGTCFIDGVCYARREEKTSDPCLLCLPNNNPLGWSKLDANLPPFANIPIRPIYSLPGQSIQLQLEALDPEGHALSYVAQTSRGTISSDGLFTWNPRRAGVFQIPVEISDICGANVEFEVQIEVFACTCQNGGSCSLDPISGPPVTCVCAEGYTGPYCEQDTRTCMQLCEHGECISVTGRDTCVCQPGYTGETCSSLTDPCDSNPCYEGVRCFSVGTQSFICGSCPRGMTGNGQVCKSPSCANCPRNAVCNRHQNCVCPAGRGGNGCLTAMCNPPCQNNGRCVRPNVCHCPPGFRGPTCEEENVCVPLCRNRGRCTKHNTCVCRKGFFGNRCEATNCGLQCENGGYCSGVLQCRCKTGYTGTTCAIPVCSPHCRNGGICVRPGVCSCPRGFHGSNCQIAICSHSCLNGGTCMRQNVCICQPGYFGRRCQTPTCEPRCMNGGRCVAPNRCSCPSGYKGKKCHKAICVTHCRNGGTCVKPNVCACKSGYTGSSCQTAICNRPCMYGGRCVERDRCQCRPGRRGRYCEKPTRRRGSSTR